MDRFTQEKLHLNPRSHAELRTTITNFEAKWAQKARHLYDERVERSGR